MRLVSVLRPEQMPQAAQELLGAAEAGHLEVARALLNAGVDKNWRDDWRNATALFYASSQGHLEIVRLLLDAGANPRLEEHSGYIPLGNYFFCLYKNQEGIKHIIFYEGSKGSTGGQTALMCAASQGHVEISRLLLGAGAETNLCGTLP